MDLEGNYSCYEMKKSIYGRQEKSCRAGGTGETREERWAEDAGRGHRWTFPVLTLSRPSVPQVPASYRLPCGL